MNILLMVQLHMLSWLNQVLTTTVVMFFFYALLALVFLPNISSLFKRRIQDDKAIIKRNMSSSPVNSCFLGILTVPFDTVKGICAVRKATSKVDRLETNLNNIQLDCNTLLGQKAHLAYGWDRNALVSKRLENLMCDELSAARDIFPQASQSTLQQLNTRLIHQSADAAFAKGKSILAWADFKTTSAKVTGRLANGREKVEAAQQQVDLLLNDMSTFDSIVFSISQTITPYKVLLFASKVVNFLFS
jgi:hypothetical protein